MDGTGPNTSIVEKIASLKKLVTRWEDLMIGTSGPISVGENEPQRPDTASDINIEHGRAVCE